jgi:hypothetical protein
VEQQYQAWLAPAQLWTDILSSLLIVAAMLIVALRPVSSKGRWHGIRWLLPAVQAGTVFKIEMLCPAAALPILARLTAAPYLPQFLQPFQLWHNAPGTLALGAGMLAPLAFTLLSGPRYAGAPVIAGCLD